MTVLDVAGLRERLARPAPAEAVYGDDGVGRREAGVTPAAVLVPIIAHPELTVLFTKRTAQLRAHSGQVSFPGGRAEPMRVAERKGRGEGGGIGVQRRIERKIWSSQ